MLKIIQGTQKRKKGKRFGHNKGIFCVFGKIKYSNIGF